MGDGLGRARGRLAAVLTDAAGKTFGLTCAHLILEPGPAPVYARGQILGTATRSTRLGPHDLVLIELSAQISWVPVVAGNNLLAIRAPRVFEYAAKRAVSLARGMGQDVKGRLLAKNHPALPSRAAYTPSERTRGGDSGAPLVEFPTKSIVGVHLGVDYATGSIGAFTPIRPQTFSPRLQLAGQI